MLKVVNLPGGPYNNSTKFHRNRMNSLGAHKGHTDRQTNIHFYIYRYLNAFILTLKSHSDIPYHRKIMSLTRRKLFGVFLQAQINL